MYIIDTHTHLYSESFDEDRTAMIERAIQEGVQKMLLPNIDVDSIEPMYTLCEQFPRNCFPMMGLHPGYINEKWEENLAIVKQHLFERENIAVGEIGMDLYWDKTFKNEQAQAFRIQIEWAKELNLPIVIHARDAFDEIFEIVDDLNDSTLSGVFHCFTGNLEQAKRIENYGGFKIGIGGVLTYKKSGLDEVVKDIPLDLLVLETDSPYLPPTPFRGKRNESAYINYVAEKLADIKGMSVDELANFTTQNAENLFKKIS
ncbi:MAG: TatD family hydrolase [Crocinitomicaceae bacterium]|nr:TatD family hydrolase [Crocinitomicaceae bacterium]MCF8435110.1 TatD family hydrolase [Crocinitomicaceae bacterium]